MGNASNDFAGYRFSFGTAHAPNGSYYAYGYKTNFAPSVGTFGTVTLPLQSFSDYWDAATGDAITTCARWRSGQRVWQAVCTCKFVPSAPLAVRRTSWFEPVEQCFSFLRQLASNFIFRSCC